MYMNRRRFLATSAITFLGLNKALAQAPEQPLPALQPMERLDGPPLVSARAWAIADGSTGRFLWGGNESAELVMASTTKIMTAWIVLQAAAQNEAVLAETITISEQAARTIGSSARIRTGDRIPVREMLYGLLLPSGNDAAAALAEHFGPRYRTACDEAPVPAFVAEMNRQARALQLEQTRYFDPHGLGRNHTSARNLATLAFRAMQNDRFRAYVRTRRHTYQIQAADGTSRPVTWNNTNKLLDIEGYEGIKTGTTNAAGSCLVASGRRGADHLYVVVLGATSNDNRYMDARNLFRWAWRQRAMS